MENDRLHRKWLWAKAYLHRELIGAPDARSETLQRRKAAALSNTKSRLLALILCRNSSRRGSLFRLRFGLSLACLPRSRPAQALGRPHVDRAVCPVGPVGDQNLFLLGRQPVGHPRVR